MDGVQMNTPIGGVSGGWPLISIASTYCVKGYKILAAKIGEGGEKVEGTILNGEGNGLYPYQEIGQIRGVGGK